MPCATSTSAQIVPVCHTAIPGEECYENVEWVLTEGIYMHSSWYPHLTASSSFDEVQETLFSRGRGNCQKPCPSTTISTTTVTRSTGNQECHTALPGEKCYGDIKWAMIEGLQKYPERYPGLSHLSSLQDFQSLYEQGNVDCPKPCPVECHTATPGDDCYESIQWAKLTGVHSHPSWYPGLTGSSSLEHFQELLFREGNPTCSRPC